MPSTLTVCICTYNRCESLRRTLESLAAQANCETPGLEVLVVDNNSTDATADVVGSFEQTLPIRRVIEARQGLSYARNRAVADFRTDVLLFTDDDVVLSRTWLDAYRHAVDQFPEADYFGGRVLPEWDGAKPAWIAEHPLPLIDGLLCWFDHGEATRLMAAGDPIPIGASFAIRRRVFDRIGPFRVDLGTGGSGSGRGEETEFMQRAQSIGATGAYVGAALCFHVHDPRRTTLRALYRYGFAVGRSRNAIGHHPHFGSYPKAVEFLIRGFLQILNGRGDLFRQCVINAGIEAGSCGAALSLNARSGQS